MTCHLCQKELGGRGVRAPNGMFWCRDSVGCKHRARLRLGVPYVTSREMLDAERGRRP